MDIKDRFRYVRLGGLYLSNGYLNFSLGCADTITITKERCDLIEYTINFEALKMRSQRYYEPCSKSRFTLYKEGSVKSKVIHEGIMYYRFPTNYYDFVSSPFFTIRESYCLA